MEQSPIADEALEALAERISRRFRLVRARAPKEVTRRVLATMEGVHAAVHGSPGADVAERVALMRALEELDAELAGRTAFEATLYREGRLGVIRAFDPIRIREVVDDRRVRHHLERYVARAQRAEDRMRWFYRRAGLEVDPRPAPKPWQLPYAGLQETHELLWGNVART
ncbi:MAG: hypothetical protein H6744_03730 [Deltaproteobacteria bacterium]|nr:hypothetical protein [Deltaproteobacteria bacterium]MCB9785787.1 hypothetical protein [Deltaproteobacteria bacterium]